MMRDKFLSLARNNEADVDADVKIDINDKSKLVNQEQIQMIREIDYQLDFFPDDTISLQERRVSYIAIKLNSQQIAFVQVLFADGNHRCATENDVKLMYMQTDKHKRIKY